MFFAVILTESRILLTIPAQWCYKIDIVRNYTSGLRQWKDKIIFYSPNEATDPDFRLGIENEFDPEKDACYMANVLGTFFTAEDADTYLRKRRHVLPKIYAEGRISHEDVQPEAVQQVDDPLIQQVKQEMGNDDEHGGINSNFDGELVDLALNDTFEELEQLDLDIEAANGDEIENNVNGEKTLEESDETDAYDSDLPVNEAEYEKEVGNNGEDSTIELDETNARELDLAVNQSVNEEEILNNLNTEDPLVELAGEKANDQDAVASDNESEVSNDENSSEGDVIVDSDAEIPRPQTLKAEDKLSGLIPFQLRENNDRYYPNAEVTIRESIVETLLLWNTSPLYDTPENDFMFVQFSLIDMFGGTKLSDGDFHEEKEKLAFAKELFAIRVQDDVLRLSRFDKYAEAVAKQFQDKIKSNH